MISEDTPIGHRRRQGNAVNDTMDITLELGSRPEMNRSSPGVSTVEEQLNGTNTESVDNVSSQEVCIFMSFAYCNIPMNNCTNIHMNSVGSPKL